MRVYGYVCECVYVSPDVFVLDRALRMLSVVISTRDRMLAKAGLGGAALEAADWPEGVVGVPGEGRDEGLGAGKQTNKYGNDQNQGIKRTPTEIDF